MTSARPVVGTERRAQAARAADLARVEPTEAGEATSCSSSAGSATSASSATSVASITSVASVVALLASVCLALVMAHPANGQPRGEAVRHQSSPTTPGRPTADVSMRLVEQDAVVEPDGSFTVFLDVDGAPPGSDLAIDIYPVIDDRDLLDDALAGELRNSQATFPVVDVPTDADDGPVRTGFSINIYPRGGTSPGGGWAKRLTEAGVYPVRVRLRGPDNQTISTLVTFLVRGPGDDEEWSPVQVALLAQISDDTEPDATVELDGTPFDDETIARVQALLDTFSDHPDAPASFAVPARVARRLAASSTQPPAEGTAEGEGTEPPSTTAEDPDQGGETSGGANGSGGPVPGGGQAAGDGAASDPITRLRDALGGSHRELLSSPFVDVDPAELVAGRLTEELDRQHHLGFRDLAEIIEPPAADTWLVPRRLDARSVDALAGIGVTNLLVPPTSLSGDVPTLPFRAVGTTGASRAVVVDPSLTTGEGDDPTLAAHRLIAQSIARFTIGDRAPQIIAVPTPESVEDIAELETLLDLLSLTSEDDLVQPTTATDLMRSARTAPDRSTLARPTIDPLGVYPDDLLATRELIDAYASTTPTHPELAERMGERLSRSATAGLSPDVRHSVVEGVREGVEAEFALVTIPESDRVTLGARDAQFPLVVSSSSDVPLTVMVELSSASDRLTVEQESIEVVLENERTVVPVRVHSRSPGDTPIRISVTTLDGNVILSEGTYSIRSTAVSGVGLLLTVGAGLFLAVWWGRHLMRSRRTRGRHSR